ncbi:suppressor of actin, putative [Pediculus humanus corporis]|uniref:Suppressor of actin, putative n=1 Tax=Pediculus humanus subsp. corporis TaxID=121224 RepID=E0VJW7_PEDHC|nr:suppressor of actin, putative [Pediculus humanus corporis]EEB13673.1 suppressor of actin, putative [Pediculus humanus corporis]
MSSKLTQSRPSNIELFKTEQYYIFVKNEYSLWWNRTTGELTPKTGWDLASAIDPECLGICYGIIGKVQIDSIVEPRLVLIKEFKAVGEYVDGHVIYKIKSVAFLSLGNHDSLNLTTCKKHQHFTFTKKSGFFDQKSTFAKTLGAVKSATNSIKNSTQQAAALAIPQVKFKFISKDKDKFEKRILDELNKIFTDTDSFYFSMTYDLTNSLQRHHDLNLKNSNNNNNNNNWQNIDDRFFWNKYMIRDMLNSQSNLFDPWIFPVIQGFVQIENCKVEIGCDFIESDNFISKYEHFKIILISRRSRHRAGTRYKRRGVDDDGNCANYVETEQILVYGKHKFSFVQIRGSVPIFWSQPGYKYRPPPRLDRGPAETQIIFEKHFQKEIETYGPICIVNLVEQTGKEKIIWDAYTNHVLAYNEPKITYATFDFHEYCRGMRFENVSYLTASLEEVVKNMGYCWKDEEGLICLQNGVFRVNCIDCLDRTNVVQTALAKFVLEIQMTKLGLIVPEGQLPQMVRTTFQLLWANNGDIISKQYAGTNALKGDYTRTGERKFTGLMKDGMNSANRYYLSRFKDAYRQASIDMMCGNEISEEIFNTEQKGDEEDSVATAEHVKLLIEDSKKLLINDLDMILGSWGLIDADPVTGDSSETDMDTILILTKDAYYVADYDEQIDRVTKYQKVKLKDVVMIELGPNIIQSNNVSSMFKFNKSANIEQYCFRIHYLVDGEDGYFHMFRSTNLRFFNNMTVVIKSAEEMQESLKAICETFLVAFEIAQLPPVMYVQGKVMDKQKSKLLDPDVYCRLGSYLDLGLTQGLTRNISETQLVSLKSAGTKALNNITQQFSKINRLGQSLRKSPNQRMNKLKNLPSPPCVSIESQIESRRHRTSFDYFDDLCPLLRIRHMHMLNVGILMKNENPKSKCASINNANTTRLLASPSKFIDVEIVSKKSKIPFLHSKTDVTFDKEKLDESMKTYREFLAIKGSDKSKLSPPKTLNINRKLSRSSNEIEEEKKRKEMNDPLAKNFLSTSDKDVSCNLVSSQSENALKSLKANFASVITSPAAVTKDMLSPFSKLAKGVHSLGANLDPRKLKGMNPLENSYKMTESHIEGLKKLDERWKNCNVKLIAL